MLCRSRALLLTLVMALVSVTFPSAAFAVGPTAARSTLKVSATEVDPGAALTFTGRVSSKTRRPVWLQVRTKRGWTDDGPKTKTNRQGKFTFERKAPKQLGAVQYRVQAKRFKAAGTTYQSVVTPSRKVELRYLAPATPTVTRWSAETGVFAADWIPVTTDVTGAPIPDQRFFDLELSVPGQAPVHLFWDSTHVEFSFERMRAMLGELPHSVILRVRTTDMSKPPGIGRPASAWSTPLTADWAFAEAPTQ